MGSGPFNPDAPRSFIKLALCAPKHPSREPCCLAKVPDGPQVLVCNVLWLQKEGAQMSMPVCHATLTQGSDVQVAYSFVNFICSFRENKASLLFGLARFITPFDLFTVTFTDEMDAEQVALQESKYEIISSESSYYKSLLILQTVFVTSKELTDTAVLRNEDHTTLFSSAMKGW
jgi:hypothetical protein